MNIGVIFAGGVGKRMGSKDRPKQFLEIFNKPIIIYTLEHFEKHPEIDAIVIACVRDYIDYLQKLIDRFALKKVRKIVPGGESGQLSIYNGLCAAKEISGDEKSIVLIHDGVRPLIDEKTITDNLRSVEEKGSAITAVLQTETIVVVDDREEVLESPERSSLRIARAPQSFYLDDILANHRKALQENRTDFTDSCCLMRHYGFKCHTVVGPSENIKITTPDDYYSLRAILEAKENAQIYGMDGETWK
ncbi:MAG: 2-C-methyl-D-erythritol 4-phosphate cytidylyltransferase [Erysipelotrichaceae bacterium]|nr:2-C-methyl-D-erythritol 4-phosphate cytidylyltransferase [Erysipelotrichaceae bacterium]